MYKKMESMRAADELFDHFVDKHATLLLAIIWAFIAFSGVSVFFNAL